MTTQELLLHLQHRWCSCNTRLVRCDYCNLLKANDDLMQILWEQELIAYSNRPPYLPDHIVLTARGTAALAVMLQINPPPEWKIELTGTVAMPGPHNVKIPIPFEF